MLFHRIMCGVALYCALINGPAAQAQSNAKSGATKLIALVIGNAKYQAQALRGPDNDARDMAAVLKSIGFEISNARLTDLTRKEMVEAIRTFESRVDENTVAVLYYSGHGLEDQKKNYLVPVDAKLTEFADIQLNLIALDNVIDDLARKETRSKIIILDACRNMPMALKYKSVGDKGGLAAITRFLPGTRIIYSASPESVSYAAGPNDRNSVFTAGILQAIKEKKPTFDAILNRATELTLAATNNRQYPWSVGNMGMEIADSVSLQANPFSQKNFESLAATKSDPAPAPKKPNCNEISEQVLTNGVSTWRKVCR